VSEQGKWIAIDFGIMGTLTEQDKQYLGQMLCPLQECPRPH
jgi:predicted unusual protein kinase regulating ubiquinone biosynthesis (AarF/ABC1/UbiB family)